VFDLRETGIAVVQYPSGPTLYFLFRLRIDEQSRGGFRSNIGRGTPLPRYILAANVIIIGEVWMGHLESQIESR
jgi:hypothetical protein